MGEVEGLGRRTRESGRPGRQLGEAELLLAVGAGGKAEAGAALHSREAELRVPEAAALNAAPAVAPPLLHRSPHPEPLRAPGGAAAAQLVRAGQGPALALAGGRGGVRGIGQTQVLQQAGDGAGGGAHVPAPVGRSSVHVGQDVPQALQAGSDRPLLQGAAGPHLTPSARLCNKQQWRPFQNAQHKTADVQSKLVNSISNKNGPLTGIGVKQTKHSNFPNRLQSMHVKLKTKIRPAIVFNMALRLPH